MIKFQPGSSFAIEAAALLAVLLGFVLVPAANADTTSTSSNKTVLETGTVSKTIIRSTDGAAAADSNTASGKGTSHGKTKGKGHGLRHHRHHGTTSSMGTGFGKASSKASGPARGGATTHKSAHRASGSGVALHTGSNANGHQGVSHKPPAAVQKPKPLLNMTAVPDVRAAAKQLIESGSLQSADWLLKKAIEFNPDNTTLTNDLADVALARAKKLIDQGYLECALIRLREALFMNPDLAEAEELINEILRKQGHDPENPDERLKLADGLAKDHRYIAAIVEYRESLKLRPSAEAFTGLGDMYARAGQPEMARSAYQQALAVNPMYPVAQSRAASFPHSPAKDSTDLDNPNGRNAIVAKDAAPGVLLMGLWRDQSLSRYMEFAHNAARTARFARTTTTGSPRLPARQTIAPQTSPQAQPLTPHAPSKMPDFLLMNPQLPQDVDGDQLPDKFPTKISQRLPSSELEHCACE